MKKTKRKDSVHDLRVEIKQFRARIRLLKQLNRPGTGALNRKLQRISHLLSPVRDRRVQNAWLRANGFPMVENVKAAKPMRTLKAKVQRIGQEVNKAFATSKLSEEKKRLLLETTVRLVKKAWKIAKKTKRDEALHELRKRAKDLQYQLEAFGARAKRNRIQRLTRKLGNFQDRVHIEELLNNNPKFAPRRALQMAEKEKRQAKRDALQAAEEIFG